MSFVFKKIASDLYTSVDHAYDNNTNIVKNRSVAISYFKLGMTHLHIETVLHQFVLNLNIILRLFQYLWQKPIFDISQNAQRSNYSSQVRYWCNPYTWHGKDERRINCGRHTFIPIMLNFANLPRENWGEKSCQRRTLIWALWFQSCTMPIRFRKI